MPYNRCLIDVQPCEYTIYLPSGHLTGVHLYFILYSIAGADSGIQNDLSAPNHSFKSHPAAADLETVTANPHPEFRVASQDATSKSTIDCDFYKQPAYMRISPLHIRASPIDGHPP
jgi:hypothetical protein